MIVVGQLNSASGLSTTAAVQFLNVPAASTVVLSNNSGASVFVGGANVTDDNGFEIATGAPPVTFTAASTLGAAVLYVKAAASGTLTGGFSWLASTTG